MASDHRQRKCYYQNEETSTPLMVAESGNGTDVKNSNNNNTIVVDEKIWKACAGSLVKTPKINSVAYYFPQGHLEQSQPSISVTALSSQVTSQPFVNCRVQHVSFHADSDTDEVFVKILLLPVTSPSNNSLIVEGFGSVSDASDESDESEVVSFAKVLTASDANNGGGFSVPRFCADSIFPPLDFEAEPPVQVIRVKDVHGNFWEFRHIYRGTPRRHLLTTGWSKFVNSKKLVAGDSVVFIRNKLSNELFVGVRRAVKQPQIVVKEGVFANWGPPQGYFRKNSGGGGRGKMAVEKVVETVEKAVCGMQFEVVYYPRPGVAEFVVEAVRVERALRMYWSEGIRVKMANETEDSSRLQWFQGTVVNVAVPENGPFCGSTWRMLEVNWDEHELPKNININKVSPWQVECVPPTPPIHATFPPPKKVKYSTNSGVYDGEEEFPLPSVGFNSVMEQLSSSYLDRNSFPAGMQGARHNQLYVSNIPNNSNDGTHQIHPECRDDSLLQRGKDVTIDLNVGKIPSETPSPDTQNSVQFFSTTATKKDGITSFQLFGQTIQMKQPSSSIEEINSTEGAGNITMDHPLADSYKNLHDKLDAQCKRPSVAG